MFENEYFPSPFASSFLHVRGGVRRGQQSLRDDVTSLLMKRKECYS